MLLYIIYGNGRQAFWKVPKDFSFEVDGAFFIFKDTESTTHHIPLNAIADFFCKSSDS